MRPKRTATHWGAYDVFAVDGRVERLVPSAADPDPSPIGDGMPQALNDRARILTPAVREGWLRDGPGATRRRRGAEPFVTVSWAEAIDLAAGELTRVRETHGNEAVFGGSYGWGSAGRFHHPQSQCHRFLALCGGYVDSVNSYSCAAMEVILPHVIGGSPWRMFELTPQWTVVAEHGELVVAFGGAGLKNSQVNAGGVGQHKQSMLQRACREAGVEFVNVGPIRDALAPELEARWLRLAPNTDVALMLGLAHTIVTDGAQDHGFLDDCCVGSERLVEYICGRSDGIPKDPWWASRITGIDAEVIIALAREIVAKRTLISVSWSVQRADHGEMVYWMAVALAAMSGSMGRPGGGFGSAYGAMASLGAQGARVPVAALGRSENNVRAFIPVARIADMLLNPGRSFDYDGQHCVYPDIRLVYWCGGNPFHHHQDLNRLVAAWQRPETIVVHDSWWTATARFADIVLPAATALERNDIACGTQDRWLQAMDRAADPPGQAKTDYEIFAALAERLGFADEYTEGRTAEQWVKVLYEQTREGLSAEDATLPEFDEFWRRGAIELPEPRNPSGDEIAALREDPKHNRLSTPSGRIELFSATIASFGYDDCPGHPTWLEPAEWLGATRAEQYPLHLVSTQPAARLHSQYDNGRRSQERKIKGREPIVLNEADARARGIEDGDVVRVFNSRGACLAGARLTTGIRAGVVEIATGAWYDPLVPGEIGSLDVHGNPNVLTLDRGTSKLAQGPVAQTCLVEVERYEGELPPIRAFDRPVLVTRKALVHAAGRARDSTREEKA